MPASLLQQINDLLAAIRSAQRIRAGRLVAVTLGVPAELEAAAVVSLVQQGLSDVGTPPVEIRTRRAGTALQLLSVEFER